MPKRIPDKNSSIYINPQKGSLKCTISISIISVFARRLFSFNSLGATGNIFSEQWRNQMKFKQTRKNLAHSILHTRRMRPVNTWPFCDCAVTGVCAPFILINMTFFNVLLLLLWYTYTSRTRTNLRYIHTHNRLVSCLLFYAFSQSLRGETNEKFVKFWILGKFLSDFWGSWFFYARNKIKLFFSVLVFVVAIGMHVYVYFFFYK